MPAVRRAAIGRDAVRHRPVGYAAIWVPAVRYARARRSARRRTVGPATSGHAVITGHAAVALTGPAAVARDAARRDTVGRDGARWESAWLAWMRASRLTEPLLPGRHIARTA